MQSCLEPYFIFVTEESDTSCDGHGTPCKIPDDDTIGALEPPGKSYAILPLDSAIYIPQRP